MDHKGSSEKDSTGFKEEGKGITKDDCEASRGGERRDVVGEN